MSDVDIEALTGGDATDFAAVIMAIVNDAGGGAPTDLANDPGTTTGLTYGYKAGHIQTSSVSSSLLIAAGTVELTDASVNLVFASQDFGVIVALDGRPVPAGAILIATVITVAGEITTIVDERVFIDSANRNYSAVIIDGGYKESTGLSYTVSSGASILFADGIKVFGNPTVSLTDDATNYVELQASAEAVDLVSNIVGFTVGNYPVASVVTVGGEVDSVSDARPFASVPAPAGASGSFTTVDSKTVTVVDGIITAITP